VTKFRDIAVRKTILLILCFLSAACQRSFDDFESTSKCTIDSVPAQTVGINYIKHAMKSKDISDREKLGAYFTGEMKQRWKSLSAEAFNRAYVNKALILKKFRYVDSGIIGTNRDREWYVYQVSFERPNQKAPLISYPRKIIFVRSKGQWLIESIKPAGSNQISEFQGMFL
jgi:hypothetical protein